MSKTISRLKPVSSYRIGVTESWLNYMANKGLILETMGKNRATFKKDEPKNINYRIEISEDKDGLGEEKIRQYKNCGWTYITSYEVFHFFASSNELNTTEVYIIPEEHGKALNLYCKKYMKQNLTLIGMLLLIFLVSCLFSLGKFYSFLVNLDYFNLIYIAIVIFFFMYEFIEILHLRKLSKDLSKGVPVNHNMPWRGTSIIYSLLYGISTIIIPLIIIIPLFLNFTNYGDGIDLPSDTSSLPVITLKDIETKETLKIHKKEDYDDYNYNSHYTKKSTFFAPLIYTSNEAGYVAISPTTTYAKSHDVMVNTVSYKLRFKYMSKKLLKDLWEEYKDSSDLSSEPLILKDDTLDLLAVYRDNHSTTIFACSGKGVMKVTYVGKEDESKVISAMKEKLEIIDE